MANYTVNYAKHATLTASVIDVVTATESASYIVVSNRSLSGTPIYYTIGHDVADTPDPAAAANNTFAVGPGATLQIPTDGTSSVIKLISADPQSYSVMVF